MFSMLTLQDLEAKSVYGLVQYSGESNESFPIAHVKCDINLDDYDETHTLKCLS